MMFSCDLVFLGCLFDAAQQRERCVSLGRLSGCWVVQPVMRDFGWDLISEVMKSFRAARIRIVLSGITVLCGAGYKPNQDAVASE